MARIGFALSLIFLAQGYLLGQSEHDIEAPPIRMARAEESYLYIQNSEERSLLLQPLKLISIDADKGICLTLGGGYRSRVEHTTNLDYTSEDETYYAHRLSFHGSLLIGSGIRFFGEVYHGLSTGENRLFQDDDLDLHQGFVAIDLLKNTSSGLSLRLGRQEIAYGVSRLIGIREGPNMRRSFDLAKLSYQVKDRSVNIIYGKELTYGFDAFDNESNLFDSDASNPVLWGVYLKENQIKGLGNLDFYYFGFNSKVARFSDASGEETRHSVGVRSYGTRGRFSFNTEFIFQFGEIGDSDISAFNFETDWKYQLTNVKLKPKIGLRLDFSSGDQNVNDGKVHTFNPLFVNPAIYSLAAVNTPANLTSLHPNVTIHPTKNLSLYMDYALFYRTRVNDGLYTPPRFLLRSADGLNERHIGDVIGLQLNYEINRNLSLDLRCSYFITGKFIKASGESENTLFVAPTVDFKF